MSTPITNMFNFDNLDLPDDDVFTIIGEDEVATDIDEEVLHDLSYEQIYVEPMTDDDGE